MSLIWSNMSLTSSMLYAVTSLYRKISDTRPQSPITYLQIHKGGWRQGRSPLNIYIYSYRGGYRPLGPPHWCLRHIIVGMTLGVIFTSFGWPFL